MALKEEEQLQESFAGLRLGLNLRFSFSPGAGRSGRQRAMALPEDAEPAPPRLPERRRAPGGAPAPPVTPGCPLPGTALAPPAPASLSPPVPATHQLSQLPPSARSCPPWVSTRQLGVCPRAAPQPGDAVAECHPTIPHPCTAIAPGLAMGNP